MSDWDEGALGRLRAAAHRGDGRGGVAVLAGRPLLPVLQYAGDVLVAALAQDVPDAEKLVRQCLAELHRRGSSGDRELADEVAGALDGAGTRLEPLPVDLGAVAAALEDGTQFLDLVRGDVVDEIHDEFGRWLTIPREDIGDGEEERRGAARHWLASRGFRAVPRSL
ncbi:hypothetical protein [Spirillospora albida]|uniref:hypothetical protein n=1 Tax=Spirillospora albida TaxID=58123 RepID=UPI0012FC2457|nr:hypothetical protein [Spirillospora albida]